MKKELREFAKKKKRKKQKKPEDFANGLKTTARLSVDLLLRSKRELRTLPKVHCSLLAKESYSNDDKMAII